MKNSTVWKIGNFPKILQLEKCGSEFEYRLYGHKAHGLYTVVVWWWFSHLIAHGLYTVVVVVVV